MKVYLILERTCGEQITEEHWRKQIENIIAYVQSVGWANVHNEPFYDVYERYGKNGQTQVTAETFKWLLNMAIYVVYHATMGIDFSEEENG